MCSAIHQFTHLCPIIIMQTILCNIPVPLPRLVPSKTRWGLSNDGWIISLASKATSSGAASLWMDSTEDEHNIKIILNFIMRHVYISLYHYFTQRNIKKEQFCFVFVLFFGSTYLLFCICAVLIPLCFDYSWVIRPVNEFTREKNGFHVLVCLDEEKERGKD